MAAARRPPSSDPAEVQFLLHLARLRTQPRPMSKQLWPAAADQVDQIALPLEQNMQAPIAEAAALLGDRPHELTQGGIIRPERLVSDGHAATADGFTRPQFAHPVGVHESDSFPLPVSA